VVTEVETHHRNTDSVDAREILQTLAKSSTVVTSKVGPGEYSRIEQVTVVTLERAKLPPETPVPMTRRA